MVAGQVITAGYPHDFTVSIYAKDYVIIADAQGKR